MIVRILTRFILTYFLVLPVMADDIIHTPGLEIHSDQQTGVLSAISVDIDPDDGLNKFRPVINQGDLISLNLFRQAEFVSQRLKSVGEDKPIIETHYNLGPEGLSATRKVQPGATPYSILISYEITSTSVETLDLTSMHQPFLYFGKGFESEEDPGGGYAAGIYAYRDLFLSHNGITDRVEEFQADSTELRGVNWAGWINRYYVVAVRVINQNFSLGLALEHINTEDNEKTSPSQQKISIRENGDLLTDQLQPGQTLNFSFESIIAPKQWRQLSSVEPELDGVVQIHLWGWLRDICSAIWQFIEVLFKVTGNWGITIILLALVVRIITIPVTRVSLRYQKKAALQQEKIAPLLKEVKEKYKGMELSEQLVALYKRENFDQLAPFKGMMGLFIQIPIFIALFNILGEAPELNGVSFLWIDNLALSDRLFPLGINLPFFGAYFNLLPFLMAFITVLSTWYAVKQADDGKAQSTTLFGMAAVFFILFYSFPAALVLYWMCSNLFQLLQQLIENRFEGKQRLKF